MNKFILIIIIGFLFFPIWQIKSAEYLISLLEEQKPNINITKNLGNKGYIYVAKN